MKHIFIIIIGLCFTFNISGQQVKQDTIEVKENVSKLIRSPWGIQLGVGVSKFIHDKETAQYFGNYLSGEFKLTIYYKNFFFAGDFRPMTINLDKPLFFEGKELNELADLNVIKKDLMIGYNLNILPKLSIEPYIGYLNTAFRVINEDELKESYDIKSAKGFTSGITINKYFEIKPYSYLVLFINNNWNVSNYSKSNSELGDSFYAISFGLAYKGWITKKLY